MTHETQVDSPENHPNAVELELLERFERSTEADEVLAAALRLGGLALYSFQPDEAAAYFARSQIAMRRTLELPNPLAPIPSSHAILAHAHLHLAGPMKGLLVDKRLRPHSEVEAAYNAWLPVVGNQAYHASKFLSKDIRRITDPAQRLRHGNLTSVLNQVATLGLMLYEQIYNMQTTEWTALPAVLHYPLEDDKPVNYALSYWHIDIFTDTKDEPLILRHKIYIRSSRRSSHSRLLSEDVSVVWLHEDTVVGEEADKPEIKAETIEDLRNKLLSSKGPKRYIMPEKVIRALANRPKPDPQLSNWTYGVLEAVQNRQVGNLKFLPNGKVYDD